MPGREIKRNWISRYYPAFNGLRAVAVLSVFYSHYGPLTNFGLPKGLTWSGVDLFFVLSGFLITGILFDSRGESGYFRKFYTRRALRIWPLYYGFFGMVFLVTAILPTTHGLLWLNLTYLQNLYLHTLAQHSFAANLNPFYISAKFRVAGWTPMFSWGHLWSLCVEEQFYFVWPLLLFVISSRRKLMWICGVVLFGSELTRCYFLLTDPLSTTTEFLYQATYTRCDGLAVGAWLALWLRGNELSRRSLRTGSYAVLGAAVALLVGARLVSPKAWILNSPFSITCGFLTLAFGFGAVLLLAIDTESWLCKVLRHPLLQQLGKISYGFYFFHALFEPLFENVQKHYLPGNRGLAVIPLAFLLSYALAYLSFRFWESPFLSLKNKWAPEAHPAVPAPSP